jgi:S1-C subfamily serine protease
LAVKRANVFESVVIRQAEDGAEQGFSGFDFTLSATRDETGAVQWRLARGTGDSVLVHPTTATLPDVGRWTAFVAAVINAAADLGVPVARQPLPVGPPASLAAPATTGSGFFVNGQGMAVTNAHVVEACRSIRMRLGGGEPVAATLVAADRQNDLALLKVGQGPAAHARFSAGPAPRQGEDIIVYGYPLAGTLASQGNLATGIVSALAGLKDDTRQLQITAPVQQGNSGGPLFDGGGRVIGVVTSKINALKIANVSGDIPQNVNFAIKAAIVTNFLEANGVAYDKAGAPKALSAADISDLARSFTALVSCEK